MKKIFIFAPIFAFALFNSCTKNNEKQGVSLDAGWRFKTGDNPAWAKVGFDDSKWDTIDPKKIWEDQGRKGLDGFAWYRVKVLLDSSWIENSIVKDSLKIILGKIDDCDQVFLNGEVIGENGKSIKSKAETSAEFYKEQGKWYLDRRYVLATNDPRIHWDKENLIAVRCFDQGGAGGISGKAFEVSMTGIKDHMKFDFTSTAFIFKGDSMITKNFSILNLSGTEEFKGKLEINAFRSDNCISLYSETSDIDLKPHLKINKSATFRKNIALPAILKISFTESNTGENITEEVEIPYILTPKAPSAPRINSAKVFGVRPWSPFLFKVASSGDHPLKYSAAELPEGLEIDPENGLITGSLKKKGEYILKLKVENRFGKSECDLKVIVGDVISLTPPLGWNSWNCWGLSVSDKKVRQSANAMKSSGLIDYGWTYINIDDGWEDTHDKNGNILPNSKFPNMKSLCTYVHSLGLKIGIYSSPGPKTCGGYEGSYTFEAKDAQNYANWGIDYLKYDWCSYQNIAPRPSLEQMKYPYKEMRHALRMVNRDIHYSLCQYGMGDVWTWGAEVDGNSWRTTGDIEDTWESLSEIGFNQNKCSPFSAPGRWNDPDMLVVGWVGWGPALHYTKLTPSEQYTHITLWSLLAAPLLIGCDLNQLDAFTLNLLTNNEVLAVNQDPLGRQAVQIRKTNEYEIWARDLEDGRKAVGLFNKTGEPLYVPVEIKDLQLSGKYSIRDLWSQTDLGKVRGHFEMKTQPHGSRFITLSGW
ncbi:MAG: alpha-galactosidase [Bacteroidota bacterium]